MRRGTRAALFLIAGFLCGGVSAREPSRSAPDEPAVVWRRHQGPFFSVFLPEGWKPKRVQSGYASFTDGSGDPGSVPLALYRYGSEPKGGTAAYLKDLSSKRTSNGVWVGQDGKKRRHWGYRKPLTKIQPVRRCGRPGHQVAFLIDERDLSYDQSKVSKLTNLTTLFGGGRSWYQISFVEKSAARWRERAGLYHKIAKGFRPLRVSAGRKGRGKLRWTLHERPAFAVFVPDDFEMTASTSKSAEFRAEDGAVVKVRRFTTAKLSAKNALKRVKSYGKKKGVKALSKAGSLAGCGWKGAQGEFGKKSGKTLLTVAASKRGTFKITAEAPSEGRADRMRAFKKMVLSFEPLAPGKR